MPEKCLFIALSFYRNIARQNRSSDEGLKDTIMFNGWNVKAAVNCEFDFFIVSEPLMAIFQIEVKRKHTHREKEKARQQLENGCKLFSSKIPFDAKDNWSQFHQHFIGAIAPIFLRK